MTLIGGKREERGGGGEREREREREREITINDANIIYNVQQIEPTMLVTASFTSSIRDSETTSTNVACVGDVKSTSLGDIIIMWVI